MTNRIPGPKSLLPGNLLVASPQLSNHPLSHGVVLILEHTAEGAVGVVLNSRANAMVRQWCRTVPADTKKEVLVQQLQSVIAPAGESSEGESQIPFTVFVANANPSSLDEALEHLDEDVRIFVGRVQWPAGALEVEMTGGAWMTAPALPEFIFGEHDDLWRTCVRRIGEDVIGTALGGAEFALDVSSN